LLTPARAGVKFTVDRQLTVNSPSLTWQFSAYSESSIVLLTKLIGSVAVILILPLWASTQTQRHDSRLVLESSDSRLVEAFDWAKGQALAFAFDGDPVGPWYEAALPGREAFCMRDVAHQSTGAHAIGLAPHTANMLHHFAENISSSRDWCSYWEMDRHNRPAPVDYKSDAEFWYCLPANYDVLDSCYRMYLWTGDLAYINDPDFLNFYARTVTDYEQRWNLDSATVMKRKRRMNIVGDFNPGNPLQVFRGNPGYNEGQRGFVLGVDLLSTQYAGYLAYAGIQQARGDDDLVRVYREKAFAVRALINNTWWDQSAAGFYSRLSETYKLEGRADSALLYRDVVEDGPKLRSTLDAFVGAIRKTPSSGVEGESHHAEILYRYGVPDLAYAQMIDLARADKDRREYPEVSYSIIGAIVTGTMGITIDAGCGGREAPCIKSQSGLGDIAWAELHNIPVRTNEITVRHEGRRKTIFTNLKGPALVWRPSFAGSFPSLLVNGIPAKSHLEKGSLGREISSVKVPVAPGVTVRVETPK
jgi:hypothetical protein